MHEENLILNKMIGLEANEIHTLIIYTGGTFGMMKTSHGYAPQKDYLKEKLLQSRECYDVDYTKSMKIKKHKGMDCFWSGKTQLGK